MICVEQMRSIIKSHELVYIYLSQSRCLQFSCASGKLTFKWYLCFFADHLYHIPIKFKKKVLGDLKTFVLMTTNLCMNLRFILLHTYLSSHNSPLLITNAFVRTYTIPYLRILAFCCTTRFFKVVLQYFLWYLTNKQIYIDNAGHCSM